MLVAILMGLGAALGTLLGLFVGLPAVGFVLWPLTRGVCRVARIEIDPHDEHDPVMKLEGSLAAGLGMALGVLAAAHHRVARRQAARAQERRELVPAALLGGGGQGAGATQLSQCVQANLGGEVQDRDGVRKTHGEVGGG